MTKSAGSLKDHLLVHEEAQLRSYQRITRLQARQTLFEEGEACDEAFILESGIMMLERLSVGGARQVLAFVYPGDLMGLDVGGDYLCAAVALTDCTIARMQRRHFDELRRTHRAIDTGLTNVTKRIVAFTLDQIFMLGKLTAQQRLAYFMLHIADRSKIIPDDGVVIDMPMTRQDVADFVGLTPETVSRAISALKEQGLIESPCRNRLMLKQVEALRQLARP